MCNRCTADGHKPGSPGRSNGFWLRSDRQRTWERGSSSGESSRCPRGGGGGRSRLAAAPGQVQARAAPNRHHAETAPRAHLICALSRAGGSRRSSSIGRSACDERHWQRLRRPDWRQVRIRFILLYEQLRASRLLRDRPSGMFCLQPAIGVGAPASERRGAECSEHGEETAQAASDAGGSAPGVRQQDRARAESATERNGPRFGRALTGGSAAASFRRGAFQRVHTRSRAHSAPPRLSCATDHKYATPGCLPARYSVSESSFQPSVASFSSFTSCDTSPSEP